MKRIFLGVAFLFSLAADAKQLNVSVSAQSAILINADTGAILYEKNAHVPSYPASITKIATALYALEKGEHMLEQVFCASEDAIRAVPAAVRHSQPDKHPPYRLQTDGTHMGIKAKEELPLQALLYGLMLVSGNDAANVIAENLSGDIMKFVEEMNIYLKTIGVANTTFYNPGGLHHPEHITTAADMAAITREALKKPLFREIVKTLQYTRPETNKQAPSVMVQANRLLKSGSFFYPGAIGVKTGYTAAAQHTLVAAAERNGRTLIAVLLGCPEIQQKYKDAIALFETAYGERKLSRTLFTKEHDQFTQQVRGAKETLRGILSEDVKIDYYPAEEPTFKVFLHWDEVKLPIKQGSPIGKIQVANDKGFVLKTTPLLSERDVERTLLQCCLDAGSGLKTIFWRPMSVVILLLMAGSIVGTIIYLRKQKKEERAAE